MISQTSQTTIAEKISKDAEKNKKKRQVFWQKKQKIHLVREYSKIVFKPQKSFLGGQVSQIVMST